MSFELNRPYRKSLNSRGLLYMGGEEHEITIKDISLTGVMAHLQSDTLSKNARDIFNLLAESTLVDLYIPDMRLAGEAEAVRVDLLDDYIVIALEFRNVAYDVDNGLYKRKFYRKNMNAPGKILLNGRYRDFRTVNVSVEGMLISLDETIAVKTGQVTLFEFDRLGLKGETKVSWAEPDSDGGMLVGLEYVHMEKDAVKGIPRFAH
ncbi:MAG: PilZ domain-containing protein [Methylobacter sp.]